jgi:hypothetical protein
MQSAEDAINQPAKAFPGSDDDPLRTTRLTCTIKQPGAVHVVECGHKFDPREMPRNNCGYCWYVYWQLHPAEVVAGQSVIKVYGKDAVIKSKGTKYYKALLQAIEVQEWKKSQEEQSTKQTDGVDTTPTLETVTTENGVEQCQEQQ